MNGFGQGTATPNKNGTMLESSPNVPAAVGTAAQEREVINTIRCLAADLCQQFKGGHPGTVMGAATIGIALWRYHMRYNPLNPDWVGRDRFVLSAGHACLLQYIMLHFSGYEAWTLDEVKKYHAPVQHNMAAGHPEIEFPGVEVTTGPLGQGIANAVGLAVASKSLGARYNKDGFPIIDQTVWCFTGDGCLQEGVGQEALSLAGHWGLDNLVLIYDNNSVTVDGSIGNCFTDDTSAKLRATGWHVIDVEDGSNDLAAVVSALAKAKAYRGKPVCVNIRTIIGIGSANQGKGKVHGQALGDEDVARVKTDLGFDPSKKFVVPSGVYDYFAPCKTRGAEMEAEWNDLYARYKAAHPRAESELARRLAGELKDGWRNAIPAKDALPTAAQPTRKSSGIVVQALVPDDSSFMVGSADLLESTFVSWDGMEEFQDPSTQMGSYAGRQLRYGIREFAMCAIGNGMAAYQKGAILPVMSTFFMFWLYAAPAARMAALMKLRFIGIATHDSIGIGEDGPTHQPVELSAFYRSMPGLHFSRPADAEEVIGAWLLALESRDHPTILALSRQPVPLLEGSSREGVTKGAYTIYDSNAGSNSKADLIIVSTGTEVCRAVETAKKLTHLAVRVVSMPIMAVFDAQPYEYRSSVIPSHDTPVVAIEAWTTFGWARYAHAGLHMHTFGMSAPQEKLYEIFGFGVDNLAEKIGAWHMGLDGRIPGVGQYDDLLLGYAQH